MPRPDIVGYACTGIVAVGMLVSLVEDEDRTVEPTQTSTAHTRPPVGIVVELLGSGWCLVQDRGVVGGLSSLAQGDPYYAGDDGALAASGTVLVGVAATETSLALVCGGVAARELRDISFPITEDGEALVATTGAYSYRIGRALDGYRLVAVGLGVMQAGDGGPTTVQVRRARVTDGSPETRTPQDVLSTVLTLDSQRADSCNSTAPAVVDDAYALLQEGDLLLFDIETVSPVAPTGATGTITVQ